MLILDLVFVLLVSVVLASLITGLAGWRHPRLRTGRGTLFFLLFFLIPIVWAGGLWLTPIGPTIYGSYWLPPLLVGLLVTMIVLSIGAAGPPNPEMYQDVGPGEQAALGITAALGVFFWLLLLAAGASIAVYYAA